MNKNIGILGAGNMGSAIYQSLKKITTDENLHVCDSSQEKLDELNATHTYQNSEDMLAHDDIVILGIKPQTFHQLSIDCSEKIVISIMAGVSMESLKKTHAKKIVRTMPNLAAKVGKGVTGWIANESVTSEEKQNIQAILNTFGTSIEVQSEHMIDAITALSGSGPAYYFLLTEAIAQTAIKLGFSKEHATQIAQGTCIGAATLLEHDTKSATEWKEAVTSKGGTTAAALAYFEQQNFTQTVEGAIQAAQTRSTELNS